MIFKPVLLQAIFDGHKTVTRRPYESAYKASCAYSIQPGMARPSVGKIDIIRVSTVRLGDIDDADAVREGFRHRAAFVAYWTDLYGGFDVNVFVKRIEFMLVEQTHSICSYCDGSGVERVAGE